MVKQGIFDGHAVSRTKARRADYDKENLFFHAKHEAELHDKYLGLSCNSIQRGFLFCTGCGQPLLQQATADRIAQKTESTFGQ